MAETQSTPFSEIEALKMAIKNNPTMNELRLSITQAQKVYQSNQGLYPWMLNADGGFRFDEQPTADALQTGTRRSTIFQGGLEILKQFTIGTRLSARLDINRSSSEIPLTIPGLNLSEIRKIGPNYGTSLTLNVTQPLLRGFGSELYEAPMATAKQQISFAQLRLKQQANNLINDVLNSYWRWVRAKWELASAEARVKRTEWLTETTDAQIQSGTLAPIEHDIVDQQTAVAEQALLSAELAVEDAADELKKWVADDTFVLKELPATVNIEETLSLEKSIENAISSNPDIKVFNSEIASAKLAKINSENEKKPKLDFVGSLSQSGLSEDVLDSLSQVGAVEFTSLFLGLSFSVPLDNQKAERQIEADEIRVRRGSLNKDAAIINLKTQIKKAHRLILVQKRRATLSEKEIGLAKKNLEAIQEKFAAGRASHLEVMQVEDNLLDAELRNRQTKIDLVIASIAIRRLDGSLLDHYAITISE